MSSVIKTERLSKVYKDFWGRSKVKALDDVSFEVRPREIVGLLGPNGSGKTTTIKLLLGLLFPTEGYAYVFGKWARDVEVKNRIGFLPEESYLPRFLSAIEALDYYAQLFAIPRRERRRRIERLLDLVGIKGAERRRIGEYSKGMARRIGLAQALVNDPDLVIMDEPTSGLDPMGAREIKDLILELKAKGTTVFLTSHLLADVENVCDRVIILHQGRIKTQGGIADLLVKKNTTQITIPDLPEDVCGKIRRLLDDEGVANAVFGNPRETLEDFFVKTVK